MPLNMPGQVSAPAVLEHIDALLNSHPTRIGELLQKDLDAQTPQGIGAVLGAEDIKEASRTELGWSKPEHDAWTEKVIDHVEDHWYGKGTDYFKSSTTSDERIEILSRGYLRAIEVAGTGGTKKIVSLNCCAGDHFQFYVSDARQDTNQVTCILLTGSLRGKARLPAESGTWDPRRAREDILEPERISWIGTKHDVEETVQKFKRQGDAEDPGDGLTLTYEPHRLEIKQIFGP